jgi:IS30 family transposase
VPGHWEGDLLMGGKRQTAIGTLVERWSATSCSIRLPEDTVPTQCGLPSKRPRRSCLFICEIR